MWYICMVWYGGMVWYGTTIPYYHMCVPNHFQETLDVVCIVTEREKLGQVKPIALLPPHAKCQAQLYLVVHCLVHGSL
jgi:hypothetical protein